MTGVRIPAKLKDDSILEALCEIRFACDQPPEIAVGKLIDCVDWPDSQIVRLPEADIPSQIRSSDPNLRYRALFERLSSTRQWRFRVGGQSVSLHVAAPYPRWAEFSKSLETTFACLL
jgi:uncharacterized protein (TIGR04255 family)